MVNLRIERFIVGETVPVGSIYLSSKYVEEYSFFYFLTPIHSDNDEQLKPLQSILENDEQIHEN